MINIVVKFVCGGNKEVAQLGWFKGLNLIVRLILIQMLINACCLSNVPVIRTRYSVLPSIIF